MTRASARVLASFLHVVGFACVSLDIRVEAQTPPKDRPNILWITSEDNAAHWLGCYGNAQARTPRLDALARGGLRFRYAYSNAPVCAVARSTLLTGVHAPSQGTQHMRSRYAIPERFVPYPTLLRAAGYWCSNRSKTDFNIRGDDKACWDACSGKASWRGRRAGQPFFSIVNLTLSHESSLFPARVEKSRETGRIPKQSRLSPADVVLPPYVPDLPEVRNDFAIYHDVMTALDSAVGRVLDELERDGLADDTIVFYFSDHGGPTPRGKRYLEDTGVRVPLLVSVPERWRKLVPFEPGSVVDELVSFVDFAPTLLSLVGSKAPAHMQGRAFLGTHRTAQADDAVVFLYADRFDALPGMRRAITDGRTKYVRCFTQHLPGAPYSPYPLQMPSWSAMRDAHIAGELSGYHRSLWTTPQPAERLYDLESDPFEVHDLAADPAHRGLLERMRERLKGTMAELHDTSLVPEEFFESVAGDTTLYDAVRDPEFPHAALLDLAFMATASMQGTMSNAVTELMKVAAEADDPLRRYWALQGVLHASLRAHATTPRALGIGVDALRRCFEAGLGDAAFPNRVVAAHGFASIGDHETAKRALERELEHSLSDVEKLRARQALDR
ncbi:MAG: sulfatase [Planctomycetes bacterium]|nr:sulfatase [Planctomycetota bacterium]